MCSKICWYHSSYNGVPDSLKCDKSVDKVGSFGLPLCHEGCKTYSNCKRAFEMGGFPNKFWNVPDNFIVTPEDLSSAQFLSRVNKSIVSFVETGQNLFIHSSIPGNGKTFRAVFLANSYIRHCVNAVRYSDNWVQYILIPKLINDYEAVERLPYDSEVRQRFFNRLRMLSHTNLVVWDDFGFDSESYFETVILRSVIQSRLANNQSNIFVSSCSLQDLRNILKKTDYSRFESSVIDVELKSADFRCYNKQLFEERC